jgi:hypothetical protein
MISNTMIWIIVPLVCVIVGMVGGIEVVAHAKARRTPVEMLDGATLPLDHPN